METARAIQGMLEAAVADPYARGHEARVPGMRVGGKTSCAGVEWEPGDDTADRPQTRYCSFVGMLPMEAPRMVVLVGVESIAGSTGPYSEAAAPYFARLAPRLLELAEMR